MWKLKFGEVRYLVQNDTASNLWMSTNSKSDLTPKSFYSTLPTKQREHQEMRNREED